MRVLDDDAVIRRATMCHLFAMAMASVDHKRYDFGDSNGARDTWSYDVVGQNE
jgi:hypothetical protein